MALSRVMTHHSHEGECEASLSLLRFIFPHFLYSLPAVSSVFFFFTLIIMIFICTSVSVVYSFFILSFYLFFYLLFHFVIFTCLLFFLPVYKCVLPGFTFSSSHFTLSFCQSFCEMYLAFLLYRLVVYYYIVFFIHSFFFFYF